MDFEWDNRKSSDNVEKHGISFHEAASVFGDTLSVTVYDPDHSHSEHRFITIGMSINSRIIMVAHTETGGSIRIISARKLTKKEREEYEQNTR